MTGYIPDYTKYSFHELLDAYNHIDKEKYPDRVKLLENEIAERKRNPEKYSQNIQRDFSSQIPIKYNTFLRRFGAGIIDGFVFMPLWGLDSLISEFITSKFILISS